MIDILKREITTRGVTNATALLQNAEQLSVEVDRVDGAFARWLFCFLANPEAVVHRLAGVLKTGGRLAVMDYFNYLSMTMQPHSTLFDTVYHAVFKSFQNPGGGLEVGGHMPALLKSAGFEVDTIVPICRIGQPGSGIWTWLTEFQNTYFPELVQRGFLSESELSNFTEFWREISLRSDSFVFAPPMIGVVGTKV